MNEKFTNSNHDEEIARKLTQVAEQTHASPHFGAELEEKLRSTYKPQTGWWMAFHQVSPTLRWVGLMLLLAIVLSWSIRTLIPAPQPAAENTPAHPGISTALPEDAQNATPGPEGEGIDFRGAKLFMNAALPDSPGQTNVYQVIPSQPPTAEYARSLADRFGISSELYLSNGQLPNTSAYMVTDGKQQLIVYAENNYTYTSDMVTAARNYNGFENSNAETIIRDFLQSHGFDANSRFVDSGTFGGYTLQQLTPDGLPIQYDNYAQPAVRLTLTETGEVLSMTVLTVNYDPNGLGSFGIINAETAMQKLLDDNNSAGKIEASYSGPRQDFVPPVIWYHDYPDNKTVTIYGNISSNKAADAGQPAIVFIDAVQAVGNIAGMDALDYYTLIEATGQFMVEDGVRKFNVETWSSEVENASFFGSLRRDGGQVIVNDQNNGVGTEYILTDPPADLPSEVIYPESAVTVNGAVVGGKLYWTMIAYYADSNSMGGGGGGGGGLGFYPLNLSGTPIAFPTPTAIPEGTTYTTAQLASFLRYTVREGDTAGSIASEFKISLSELGRVNNLNENFVLMVGQVLTIPGVPGPTRLDGEEGMVQVQVFQKPDGRLREVYNFASTKDQMYYQVKGEDLQQLKEVANLPVKIWGEISYDDAGSAWLTFEKFELLYTDLPFEVLKGTQQMTELNSGSVVLFTSEGTTYIQVTPNGGYPDYSTYEGVDEVLLEVLRVPDETYAGYPAVRVFRSGLAVDPTTGNELKLPPVSSEPPIYPDPYGNADQYVQPDVTIESVELIYLANNPAYRDSENPEAPVGQGYMQPVWHFTGHYSNGDVLDVLVQALQQEYLSPELGQ